MSFARGLVAGTQAAQNVMDMYFRSRDRRQERDYQAALEEYQQGFEQAPAPTMAEGLVQGQVPGQTGPAIEGMSPVAPPAVPGQGRGLTPEQLVVTQTGQPQPAMGVGLGQTPATPATPPGPTYGYAQGSLEDIMRRRDIAAQYGQKDIAARYDQQIMGLQQMQAQQARFDREMKLRDEQFSQVVAQANQNQANLEAAIAREEQSNAQDEAFKVAELVGKTAAGQIISGDKTRQEAVDEFAARYPNSPAAQAKFEQMLDDSFFGDLDVTQAQYDNMLTRSVAPLESLATITPEREFDAEGNDVGLIELNKVVSRFDSDVTDDIAVEAVRNPETGLLEVYEGGRLIFEGTLQSIAQEGLQRVMSAPKRFVAQAFVNERRRIEQAEKRYTAYLNEQEASAKTMKLVSDQLKELIKQPTWLTMDEDRRNAEIALVFRANGLEPPPELGISTQAEGGGITEKGAPDPVKTAVEEKRTLAESAEAEREELTNRAFDYVSYVESGDITKQELEAMLQRPDIDDKTARAITSALAKLNESKAPEDQPWKKYGPWQRL